MFLGFPKNTQILARARDEMRENLIGSWVVASNPSQAWSLASSSLILEENERGRERGKRGDEENERKREKSKLKGKGQAPFGQPY